jgi:hypothetical protein
MDCGHLVYFIVIWFRFGMLYQEKSGTRAFTNLRRKVSEINSSVALAK